MRLIDADKLIELIDDDISGLNSDYISVISQTAYDVALCTFTMVKQYIDALPIVEPTKHGRWITVSDGYGNGVATASICECSLCKDTIWVYKNDKRKWKFCPNCGARMDAQIGEDKSHPFAESVMMGMDEVEE